MTGGGATSTDAAVTGAILFTDLVGFTEYNGIAGDACALDVLERQTATARSVLAHRPDARLVKELGDGLMLWSDTAAGGFELAIELMSAIEGARVAGTFPLAIRLGLHHGPVLLRGDDLVGQSVNIAARVCELAGPGELLVSDSLIAGTDLEPGAVEPIGPARVKGVDEPIWLHRVSA